MCKIVPRLKEIASNEGITIGTLERVIGASKGVLSRAINNGTDIQAKWLEAIVENYPKYSAQWLLTGTGSMLNDTNMSPSISQSITKLTNNTINTDSPFKEVTRATPGAVPLVSVQAVGGFSGVDFQIKDEDILGYFFIPKFRHMQVDFMIELIGDSMTPRLWPGDIIACSIIHRPNFIQWNKPHLISTDDQGLIVKRLRKGPDENCILAVSDNPDYDPFLIPKDEIRGLARVVGVIHLE